MKISNRVVNKYIKIFFYLYILEMSTQTVYFNDPADIVALQNTTATQTTQISSMSGSISALNTTTATQTTQITSMSGTLNSLKWNTVTSQNWTAQSNTNYIWNLADTRNASIGSAIVTFPSAPNDGDFIEIVDGLGTWGNCLYTNVGINLNGKLLSGMTATGTLTTTTCQGGFRDYRKGSVLFTYQASNNTWYANGTVGRSMTSEYSEVSNETENPWDGWWMFYTPYTVSTIIFGKAYGATVPTLPGSAGRNATFSVVYIDTSTYPITSVWYTGNPSQSEAAGAYSTRVFEYYTTGGVVDKTQLINAYSQAGSLASPPWQASATNQNSQGGGLRLQSTAGIATVTSLLIPDFQTNSQTNWGLVVKLKANPGYSQKSNVESSIDSFFNQSDVGDNINFNDQTENFKSMCLKAIYETNPQSQQIGGLSGSLATRYPYVKDPYFIGNTGPYGFNAGGIQAIEVMNQFLSPNGITFTTPITQIIKSYSGAATVNGVSNAISTGSTEVTTIFTRGASYCTPGANVTVSGLTGSWSVMNGYYPNGVSLWENITRKSIDPVSLDGVLTDTSYTGSITNTYNRFNLIFNSWSGAYEAQTTGAYLNYAQNFGLGTAQVSVTHRVYPTMGYNELFAAYMAFLNYVFGPITHTRSGLHYLDNYRPDVVGRMATNWHLIGVPGAYASRGAQDTCNTRPQEVSCVPHLLNARRGTNKYSWHMRNDPYSVHNSIYNAYFLTGPAGEHIISPFVANNYLMSGTAKSLWYGVDGPLYKNVIYNTGYFQSAGTTIGLLNLTYTGTIGGSTFVGRLFDANATPVSSGGPLADVPDTRYWAKWSTSGRTGSLDNFVRWKYAWTCGLINPDYTNFQGYTGWAGPTGTRRIGYINYSFTQIDNRWAVTSAFAPPVDSLNPTGPYNPKLATDPGSSYNAAVKNIFSVMMTYLLGPTGAGGLACDSIILDPRTNQGGGGSEGEELATFFGGNRNGTKVFSRKADDGFSPLIDPDTLRFPLDAQTTLNVRLQTIRTSENAINYPYGVFQGTGSSYLDAKKVVFLNADQAKSNGSKAPRYFAGDNKDGKIGNNTIVKFVGSVDTKFQGASTTAGYSEEQGDEGNQYINVFPYMQWNTETPSYNLTCQYVPTGSAGTQWFHVDYPTFAPTGTKNGYRGTSGIGSALPQDLQNYLYPDIGAYPGAFTQQQAKFPNLYLPGKTEVPDITNPSTWRDSWLETAIYEAMVPVLPGEN